METPVFLFLIAACCYAYLVRHDAWLAVLATLLVLTRVEGVFLVAALGLAHIKERRPLLAWKIFLCRPFS